VISGLWMLLILVAFSGLVGKIPIPTLAAVLIFAAASSLRVARIETVLKTGLGSRVAFLATLCATLTLTVAAAVGVGVLLSLLLQLNREALDLTVVRLTLDRERRFVETPAPRTLASNEVTVLDVYGSLLFAGARTLETRLPDPAGSEHPVVVLRLRGRTSLGATAIVVLAGYAERLASAGGHLFLSGVAANLVKQLRTTGRAGLDAHLTVVTASNGILDSTMTAHDDGEKWLATVRSTVH
jgi:SulP family sulfate permease